MLAPILAAAPLASGAEDVAQAWPLAIGVRVGFATQRVVAPSVIDIAAIQFARVEVLHPYYTVSVATQLGT